MASGSSTSGASLPFRCTPARGWTRRAWRRPRERSISTSARRSRIRPHLGVHVCRTSSHGANADTMSDTGLTTSVRVPVSSQRCAWTSSPCRRGCSRRAPTQLEGDRAHRVEQRRVLACRAGGRHPVRRKLHERQPPNRRGREIGQRLRHRHAPRRRGVDDASGVRSPMANASPRQPWNESSVVAQSATGTCQGPTHWSRAQRRRRSGRRSTRGRSCRRRPARAGRATRRRRGQSQTRRTRARPALRRRTSRVMRGGLPRSAARSMSTASLPNSAS